MEAIQERFDNLPQKQQIMAWAGMLLLIMLSCCVCTGAMIGQSLPTQAAIPTLDPANIESAAPAAATGPTNQATRDPNAMLDKSNLYVAYVLDGSVVMNDPLADDKTKAEVAAQRLSEHLQSYRPETNVGLWVYGHRTPPEEAEESCRDIRLIAPVKGGSQRDIITWLEKGYEAKGLGPMTAALEQALDDFSQQPANQINYLVFIGGNEDTCGRDPCAQAHQWQTRPISLTWHIIGLGVNEATRQQYQCMAEALGATYYEAETPDQLSQYLQQIQETARQNEEITPAELAIVATATPTPPPTPSPTPVVAFTATPTPITATGRLVRSTSLLTPTNLLAGQGRIAFVSRRDGNEELYIMNADGSGPVRFTNHPATDRVPAWSPDGQWLAFASSRDGNPEIYAARSDRSRLLRLTNHQAEDWNPAWSPDGSRLAFESNRDGHSEIYLVNLDGTGLARLTNSEESVAPAWSPDGGQIAFESRAGEDWNIHLINVDGSNLTTLINTQGRDFSPAWSPDGKQIIFANNWSDNWEIRLVQPDGQNQRTVHRPPGVVGRLDWSPDGQYIVFDVWTDHRGNENWYWEIYVMQAGGQLPTNISRRPVDDYEADWGQ